MDCMDVELYGLCGCVTVRTVRTCNCKDVATLRTLLVEAGAVVPGSRPT